jgi:hypothetical protein
MSINKSKARKLAEFLRNITVDSKLTTEGVEDGKIITTGGDLDTRSEDTTSLVSAASVTSYVGNKLGDYVHGTHDINLTFTGDVTGFGTITDMSHTSIGLTLDAETLPDQAGYDGYFLTTDGSVASWAEVDFSETNTSLSIAGNVLTYTDETGTDTTIDLSLYLDDTNLARLTSGSIDGNGLATFTRDDATTFTVDFSSLFDDTNLSRIDEASFNISDGVLTLTRDDDSSAATVDLDGRYVLGSGTYNNTNWDTAYGWGNHASAGYLTSLPSHTHDYLPLAGGTLTGNLTLNSATPQILFNGTSDAGVDMAIKATPEGLDFYEPEDVNKIHFQILDDTGVNAPFGYNVGTTQVIDSSGNVKKSPTLTLSGDVSGTATFTDLGNATLTATVANDSHTHDGRYYTEAESNGRFTRFINNATLNSSTSTTSFIAELINDHGCFQNNSVTLKCSWSYAGNSNLDTGHPTIGTIELAGCVVETWGGTYKHVRITRPTTGTGGAGVYEYNDQGSGYSPGWREIWTSQTDGSGSGLDADLLDGVQGSSYMRKTADSGLNMVNNNITNVNHLTFNDPGASEGLEWVGGNGWKIYESPDSLTNASGNLQFVTGTTRRMTIRTDGSIDILGGNILVDNKKGFSNSGAWTRNKTPYGYIDFGPANTSYAHIYTDRPSFYFNKALNASAYYYTSDRAFKKDIKPIKNALETVSKLQGVTYILKETEEKSIGFIAQEVEEILPQFVNGEEGQKSVNYGQMVALLTEAMKEQQVQIQKLKEEIKEMKNAT